MRGYTPKQLDPDPNSIKATETRLYISYRTLLDIYATHTLLSAGVDAIFQKICQQNSVGLIFSQRIYLQISRFWDDFWFKYKKATLEYKRYSKEQQRTFLRKCETGMWACKVLVSEFSSRECFEENVMFRLKTSRFNGEEEEEMPVSFTSRYFRCALKIFLHYL